MFPTGTINVERAESGESFHVNLKLARSQVGSATAGNKGCEMSILLILKAASSGLRQPGLVSGGPKHMLNKEVSVLRW